MNPVAERRQEVTRIYLHRIAVFVYMWMFVVAAHAGDLFKMKKERNVNSLESNIADLPVLRKVVIAPFKDSGTSVIFSTPGSHFSILAKIGSITCQ